MWVSLCQKWHWIFTETTNNNADSTCYDCQVSRVDDTMIVKSRWHNDYQVSRVDDTMIVKCQE